jgi:hypothetical protein
MKNWSRLKPKINLVIDGIMFIVIMAVAGLGFLMKWVLLPGHRINEVYGTNTDLLFWGLDRHQWGAIHLYLALLLVFLLVLHIVLHWDMIVCIFRQMIPSGTVRSVIAVVLGAAGLLLALSPLNINPEIVTLERSYRNRVPERSVIETRISDPAKSDEVSEGPLLSTEPKAQQLPEISATRSQEAQTTGSEPDRLHAYQTDIDGTMTLSEISARYNISVSELAKVINVPAQYANERLGRLKRMYGFEMDDLREFVSAGRENK